MRSILSFVTAVLNRTTPPPKPEQIEIIEVPLPPSLDNTTEGACTPAINPRRTGCIAPTGLNSGNFMPDGLHVTASVTFVGAPASPDPASVYSGLQFILLKADGTTFPNGDTWKCISCSVPDANKVGSTELGEYPQTFRDGTKAMSGVNIINCGMAQLTSENCTPNKTYIYPIRLSNEANDDGSGPGFPLRELRLHPDDVHLTFNTFAETSSGLGEVGFFGRLQFNETGSRYDLINVTILNPPELVRPIIAEGKQLTVNRSAITIGELRGLTGTGKEVVYVGYPYESCNIDLFAVSLATGAVRRITAHPEYADPIGVSPDDKWQVVLDTRGSGRLMFLSGLRSVPPITDLVTVTASSSVRNNGNRRFFEPYLLDYEGDRSEYFGQKINAAGNGSPGSINDPNWNAGADPRWSLDGTRVVYFQWLAIPPACGGSNSLLCETSPYADGREERVMIATFTNRKPLPIKSVAEAPDDIPWGTKYVPGMTLTAAEITVPAGEYTLQGNLFGYADVSITLNNANTALQTVSVAYHQFSDDGINFVAGYENVTLTPVNITLNRWDWFSNITSTGPVSGTKVTSSDGFHMEIDEVWNFFEANGTLTTTIDGVSYRQPCNYC
ncbi:hypothetical protein OIDMADRAFT_43233 [Oidiodendron maius Zn]|uniref:Saponin hydrolase n=1 Tax=Oidiodendron maius (strain Zn) TaxID=913774 RepID=A0A0C3HA92_OIDMZ|nr:hypothetical protein OIDMADRAFT_43233 [Oidiodendron maius Zn]